MSGIHEAAAVSTDAAPETYEEWLAELDGIAEELSDAKLELAELSRGYKGSRRILGDPRFVELQAEIAKLKLEHQAASRQVSLAKRASAEQRKRQAFATLGVQYDADTIRFNTALKQAAKELLTGAQYSALIVRAKEIARVSV